MNRFLSLTTTTSSGQKSNILIPKDEIRFVRGPIDDQTIITLYEGTNYTVDTPFDDIHRQLQID